VGRRVEARPKLSVSPAKLGGHRCFRLGAGLGRRSWDSASRGKGQFGDAARVGFFEPLAVPSKQHKHCAMTTASNLTSLVSHLAPFNLRREALLGEI
jgi:hypothetical protein